MAQAKSLRELHREGHFVLCRSLELREAERDRAKRGSTLRGRQARDHGGVDPRRQEDADGNVGEQVAPHAFRRRVADDGSRLRQLTGGCALRAGELVANVEETGNDRWSRCRNAHGRPRLERANTAVESKGFRNVAPYQESDGAGRLGGRIDRSTLQQRLDLRREPQAPPVVGNIQGLDPEGIASQEQFLSEIVPDCERVHALECMDEFSAAMGVEMQENFSVAIRLEPVAFRFEFLPKLAIVVDLAVEGDVETAVRARHRLGAAIGEIDDGQPPMRQADAAIARHPQPGAVRAAGQHRIADAKQLFPIHWRRALLVGERARYAAHISCSVFFSRDRRCRRYRAPRPTIGGAPGAWARRRSWIPSRTRA